MNIPAFSNMSAKTSSVMIGSRFEAKELNATLVPSAERLARSKLSLFPLMPVSSVDASVMFPIVRSFT